MKTLACLALSLALLASPAALAQSGHPEISVAGSQSQALKGQITALMFDRGFTIVSDSPSLLMFDKVSDNLGAMFLFGTAASGPPHIRVTFSFAEYGGNTRVVADLAAIANAGTAFERRNNLNFGNDAAEAQALLSTAAMQAAPAASYAPGTGAAPAAGTPRAEVDSITQQRLQELVEQKRAEAQAADLARNKAVKASTGPTAHSNQ